MASIRSRPAVPLLFVLLAARSAGATDAASICGAVANPCQLRTVVHVTLGSVLDFGTRTFQITESGRLDVDGADLLTIKAGSFVMDRGALIRSTLGSTTGGRLLVQTIGSIILKRSGASRARIDLDAIGGDGEVTLDAGGDVIIDGDVTAQATTLDGDGGTIKVMAGGDATVTGSLQVDGGGDGVGGDLTVSAVRAVVVGPGGFTGTPAFTASGGLGGGGITLDAGPSLSVATRLSANGTAADTDGGTVTLSALGNVDVTAQVSADGLGTGGIGGDIDVNAGGTATLGGRTTAVGGATNGTGGTITAAAGLDLVVSQPFVAVGGEGAGGSIGLDAGRLVRVAALVDVHGGDLGSGGDLNVGAGESVEALSDVNANGGDGGEVTLAALASDPLGLVAGGPVTVSGNLVARGGATGLGGRIQLQGCDVNVAASGALTTAGGSGPLNLLQASAQMTIAGKLQSIPSGTNRFEYREVAKPPSILIAPTPLGTSVRVATLPPCRGTVLTQCGNGTRETGEACDEGDTTPCDGCSATCTVEACGNGTPECGEACDDGNLVSGDGCDANCTPTGCGNKVVTGGEECDDGNLTDGDGCSAGCLIEVPLGCGDGVLVLGEQCDDGNMDACDDCSPTCVIEGCGNNIVECGEPCDDGNTNPCDGCAPGCRLEICGDGLPECAEECDLGAANGTPGSGCTTSCERCTLGEDASCPCHEDTDCAPLGRCGGAACESGLCTSVPVPACDDGNPCNGVETCDAGTCRAGAPPVCDDGNACNGVETCGPGGCAAGTPVVCDDGDGCTDDACDAPSGACRFVARTGAGAVRCRLDAIDAALARSGATPSLAARIARFSDEVGAGLATAETLTGRAARKRLGAVGKKLLALRRAAAAGRKKHQLDSAAADVILAAASEARDATRALRASLPR